MCRWRQVQNTYAGCGHVYQLPDQEIHCDSVKCKFSPYHPRNCGPSCSTTCWQYRQFPEQFARGSPEFAQLVQHKGDESGGPDRAIRDARWLIRGGVEGLLHTQHTRVAADSFAKLNV
ncbi:hypothetical protein C8J57DRAFT_650746 [Mycena rebaudengoi]|nr:hypothetical protein C8J57DRAFT_650746 [Mycena rebaudengoi]